MGDLPGAIAEYEKARQLSDDPFMATLCAAAKANAGDKDAARRMLTELAKIGEHREVLSYWRALLYLSLNNKEEALRWLEQSFPGTRWFGHQLDQSRSPARSTARRSAF